MRHEITTTPHPTNYIFVLDTMIYIHRSPPQSIQLYSQQNLERVIPT